MTYTIEVNEAQIKVISAALEEYFRLRMGQGLDFCTDIAGINCDLSPQNSKHNFDMYIARRDHLHELMRAVFRIAFEPTGYLKKQTDDMLIAEDIWDVIRTARGLGRWESPLHVSNEPMPKVVKKDG